MRRSFWVALGLFACITSGCGEEEPLESEAAPQTKLSRRDTRIAASRQRRERAAQAATASRNSKGSPGGVKGKARKVEGDAGEVVHQVLLTANGSFDVKAATESLEDLELLWGEASAMATGEEDDSRAVTGRIEALREYAVWVMEQCGQQPLLGQAAQADAKTTDPAALTYRAASHYHRTAALLANQQTAANGEAQVAASREHELALRCVRQLADAADS